MKSLSKVYAFIVLLCVLLLTGCTADSEAETVTEPPAQTVAQESIAPQTEPTEETTLPTEAISPTDETSTLPTNPNGLKTQTIYDKEYYDLNGLLYATELGEPVWGEKAVSALFAAADLPAVRKTITHIGDALYYISNCGIFRSSEEACVLLASLIADDYKTVGFIQFNFTDENYYLVYLEQDNTFYIFDPYMHFSAWDLQQEHALLCGADLNELVENLSAHISYYNSPLADTYISERLYFRDDTLLFWYGSTSFPASLGLPKFTREQYAPLSEEMDPLEIGHIVTTLADASRIDLDIPYLNDSTTSEEAQQRNIQAANALRRMLENDYEEIGYVYIGSDMDSCILLYIIEDGRYYLVDPCEYIMVNGGGAWLAKFTSHTTGCAENFQDIADSIIDIYFSATPESTNTIHLIRSDKDFFFKASGNKLVYPHDTEVTAFYGKDFAYADPNYRWES